MRCALLIFMLCILSIQVTANAREVFKWVDENGKVHYGDNPQGTGGKVDSLNISSKPPSSNSSLAGTPKNQLEEQKKLLESMREERIKRREAKDKKKQDSELAEHNCKQAKGQLKTYEEMPRLFTLDDQGERHYACRKRQH